MALRGGNARAGSKGCGLLSRTPDSDLALFVPGQDRSNRSEGPRDESNFRYQKKTPRSANSRPLRWVVVRNPRANAGFHSVPFGQEPRSGASWNLSSCHSTRISEGDEHRTKAQLIFVRFLLLVTNTKPISFIFFLARFFLVGFLVMTKIFLCNHAHATSTPVPPAFFWRSPNGPSRARDPQVDKNHL